MTVKCIQCGKEVKVRMIFGRAAIATAHICIRREPGNLRESPIERD